MKRVEVTSGSIVFGDITYQVGDVFDVEDERADKFAELKIAKVVEGELLESVEVVFDEPEEVEEQGAVQPLVESESVMQEESPFAAKSEQKKRGRRKRK